MNLCALAVRQARGFGIRQGAPVARLEIALKIRDALRRLVAGVGLFDLKRSALEEPQIPSRHRGTPPAATPLPGERGTTSGPHLKNERHPRHDVCHFFQA